MQTLLEAGVHFGHKTQRWNPKMRRYLFGVRNEIHIFDLQHTVRALDEASSFLADVVGSGGRVVFVGTKRQAKDTIKLCAERSGQFYVCERWLGGTLTNFETIKHRLQRLRELRARSQSGEFESLPKRDAQTLVVELQRLEHKMGGLANMTALPNAVVVVDPRREHIAVSEARTLNIPVVALTDSNCDPDEVDQVIPGNDDSIRSVGIVIGTLTEAIENAYQTYESRRIEREDLERAERERLDNVRREMALRQQEKAVPAAERPRPAAAEASMASAGREAREAGVPAPAGESNKPAARSRPAAKAPAAGKGEPRGDRKVTATAGAGAEETVDAPARSTRPKDK